MFCHYATIIVGIAIFENKYMNKKTIIPIVIALIILGGAGILVARRSAQTDQVSSDHSAAQPGSTVMEDKSQPPVATAPSPTPTPVPAETLPSAVTGHFSGEGDIEGSDVQVFDIVYDGTTFSPSSLSVKNGDVVIFKNKSKAAFRPASDPHPTHTDYPAFDAKQPIPAGKSYQFKFTKVGTWKFHDHLNPSAQGSVTVTP